MLYSLACHKSTVDGTQWPSGDLGHEHVLIDSCDDKSNSRDPAAIDWWAAPNAATGDKAFFELDLGCQRCVSTIAVRNSGNGVHADR